MAIRRQIDYAREARRALGRLRVGLQRRRSARHLPVQGLRRARARPEAWPGRRPGRRALRDAPSRRCSCPRRARATCRRLAALGLEGDYGFFDAVDYTDRAAGRRRAIADATHAGHRAHLHGPPPGHDARRAWRTRCSTTAWCPASMPTRACGPPSSCCRSGCRARCRPGRRYPRTTCSLAAPPPIPVRRYPHAAHGLSARPVPVEWPVHLRRDQRRGRRS